MALDMFLKFTGPNSNPLAGESPDPTHLNEIEVLAWSWGVSRGPGAPAAGAQDLSITTYQSRASVGLMQCCFSGVVIGSALLVVRTQGVTPIEKFKIQLTNVRVTSQSTGGSGGEDRVTENISLNFDKIRQTYLYTPAGLPPEPKISGWDIVANVRF